MGIRTGSRALTGGGGARPSTLAIQESTYRCDRGHRLLLHQPVPGSWDDLFLHIRRSGAHDGRHGRSKRLFAAYRQHGRRARVRIIRASCFISIWTNSRTANDRLGHDAGDALLREVGRRLNRTVRSDDTVARLGGDEFAILMNEAATIENAVALAQRVLAAFSEPYAFEARVLQSAPLSASPLDSFSDRLTGRNDQEEHIANV